MRDKASLKIMNNLTNRHILIGITGSIAAYKICQLVRELRKQGAKVKVVLTIGAEKFVTTTTLKALSDNAVYTDWFKNDIPKAMAHIDLGKWADIVCVAPASANFIACLANNIIANLLCGICTSTQAPIYMAPAMNKNMWINKINLDNVAKLKANNVHFWGPDYGGQACGDIGVGRMLEPDVLLKNIASIFSTDILAGKTVLITAGPTQEPIDAVRYISNYSSGKMGYALAIAARDAGANVVLISGPVNLKPLTDVKIIPVITAADMRKAVISKINDCDLFISNAAVADYFVKNIKTSKIKKTANDLTLTLYPTVDIIKEISSRKTHPLIVGFAAETNSKNIHQAALNKMKQKQMDLVVCNIVGKNKGFMVDDNAVSVFAPDGTSVAFPTQSKKQLAVKLINYIAKKLKLDCTP